MFCKKYIFYIDKIIICSIITTQKKSEYHMKNKVLSKFLLPYYITGAIFFTLGGASATLVKENSVLRKIIVDNDIHTPSNRTNYFLCAVLVILCATMGGLSAIVVPKKAHKRTEKLTKQYLKIVLAKNPEIRAYSDILNDPKSVQQIATVICNGLDKDSQKAIFHILNKTFENSDNSPTDIERAEKQIISIVQNYAHSHPEYLQSIKYAITKSFQAYVMPDNQNTK